MPNKEKVIKGLECCAAMSGDECRVCPYEHECRDTDLPYGMSHLAGDAFILLQVQPDIIRCKDCKYVEDYTDIYDDDRGYKCLKHQEYHSADWFCADAERR